MARQSRRNFLGGAAAGVAAGAFGGVSGASAPQAAGIQEMRTDVVVAGGGIGGMTAAVRAQQQGLYAAGVDIGGWSTYVYNGNLILGAASGYVSGTNAAKQSEPQGGWDPVSLIV